MKRLVALLVLVAGCGLPGPTEPSHVNPPAADAFAFTITDQADGVSPDTISIRIQHRDGASFSFIVAVYTQQPGTLVHADTSYGVPSPYTYRLQYPIGTYTFYVGVEGGGATADTVFQRP